MRPLTSAALILGIQQTLAREGLDYEAIIRSFGQVSASEKRGRGESFVLRDHVRGLILSKLSSQRPGTPIASNLPQIDRIFLDYDPDALETAHPEALINALRALRMERTWRCLQRVRILAQSSLSRLSVRGGKNRDG
jgi:hypothetical protein